MTTTSSEHRLHPVSILFDAGAYVTRLLVPFGVLLVTAWRQGDALWLLGVIGGLAALPLTFATIRYVRFRYRYDARELVVRSGLLVRNERLIPYARIQNIDASQSPLQRLLGVTAVYVQTGAGVLPEATLRVLPLAALDEMRARVLAAGAPLATASDGATELVDGASVAEGDAAATAATVPDAARARRTLLTLSPRELITAGFIENRGMVLIFGALALLDQSGVADRYIERLFDEPGGALGAAAARFPGMTNLPVLRGALYFVIAFLFLLLFIRLLSTVWAVVRLYGFRLERDGDDLHTEYGLLTRVTATIPLRRVQTIIVRHGVLHRMLGRCTVSVETAGGVVVEGSAPPREPIAPLLPVAALPALLHELQPGLDLDEVTWRPVHERAYGRILRRGLGLAAAAAGVAWLGVHAWAVALFALLAAIAALHARRRADYLGWSMLRDAVAVRDGAFMRSTHVARFSRIQVAALAQSPFDVRAGMARVFADTAAFRGAVVVPYLPAATAEALRAELCARATATTFTW